MGLCFWIKDLKIIDTFLKNYSFNWNTFFFIWKSKLHSKWFQILKSNHSSKSFQCIHFHKVFAPKLLIGSFFAFPSIKTFPLGSVAYFHHNATLLPLYVLSIPVYIECQSKKNEINRINGGEEKQIDWTVIGELKMNRNRETAVNVNINHKDDTFQGLGRSPDLISQFITCFKICLVLP